MYTSSSWSRRYITSPDLLPSTCQPLPKEGSPRTFWLGIVDVEFIRLCWSINRNLYLPRTIEALSTSRLGRGSLQVGDAVSHRSSSRNRIAVEVRHGISPVSQRERQSLFGCEQKSDYQVCRPLLSTAISLYHSLAGSTTS